MGLALYAGMDPAAMMAQQQMMMQMMMQQYGAQAPGQPQMMLVPMPMQQQPAQGGAGYAGMPGQYAQPQQQYAAAGTEAYNPFQQR